ncbi:hypothetical protein IFM89_014799 [Coptis chinensis]|uniref:Uncharacterized protein n=1 Tax=Coptis chinensis TaxID=261450 RepID=A0A835IBX4_9MAGN|nr:hypothetical protein IFM89_014799 [Coptis chinensis]
MQNLENERFDRMCNAFYETADLATDNEDKTNIVMKWIKGLNNELKKGEGACASSQPTTCGSDQPIAYGSDQPTVCETSGNVHTTTKDNGLIRSPQSVRGAGRPPFKRKTSKVEQAVKKLQEKKKKEGKREQVTKMNQGKKKKGTSAIEKTINDLDLEKDPIGGSEVMESGETQESIPLKDTIGGAELMEFGGSI